jgi:hypothetical protein
MALSADFVQQLMDTAEKARLDAKKTRYTAGEKALTEVMNRDGMKRALAAAQQGNTEIAVTESFDDDKCRALREFVDNIPETKHHRYRFYTKDRFWSLDRGCVVRLSWGKYESKGDW